MNIGDIAGVYAFLSYFSMNYRDFSGKSKLITSLFQIEIITFDFTVSKNRFFVK